MPVSSATPCHLAVWLRCLPTDRIARASPSAPADGVPLVVAERAGNALRLAALDDAAAALGLKAGMALADARARHPKLYVAERVPLAERAALDALAAVCERYTPLVALDPPDGLALDITGCAHLFGGASALCADCLARLEAQGFRARAALAPTPGAAWALARYGAESHPALQATFPPKGRKEAEDLAAQLAPLPVAALKLEPEFAADLARVGLKRIGDLLGVPRAPLAARFGAALLVRLDRVLGRAEEVLVPHRPPPPYLAERRCLHPVVRAEDVLWLIAALARELAAAMARRGEGARRLEVQLFRLDGTPERLSVGTSRPTRDPDALTRLFAEKLGGAGTKLDAGMGYELVRLAVRSAEPMAEVQLGFGAAPAGEDLARLIDRLGARLGLRRVTRFAMRESHIPEFAVAALPAQRHDPRPPAKRPATFPFEGEAKESTQDLPLQGGGRMPHERRPGGGHGAAPERPVRLFARPEPIEAMAEVPDGPPVRFRWRRVLREVALAEGPERIAMEWWRAGGEGLPTRDYFRIEDTEGRRYWLYREGLYGRETDAPAWFMHGLFA